MWTLFFLGVVALIAFGVFKTINIVNVPDKFDKSSSNKKISIGTGGVLWFALALLVFVLWMGFVTVDAGTVGVVTKFGEVVGKPLQPGAHVIIPFIESVHPVTTQTMVVRPEEDAASHDLQLVHFQVTLAYHFDPEYAGWLYSKLMSNEPNAVENKVVNPAILEAIKSNTANYDAPDLIVKRPVVRDGIESAVKTKIAGYHVIAENVSITDFHFSKDYEASIEAKVTAEQNAMKAQNDLTRIKIEAQQQIAKAEGEAAALKAQKEQITPELLQLRMIEMMRDHWDGHLPENYWGGSAPLPVVDVFKNVGKK